MQNNKIAEFISSRRKDLGFTQQQVAEHLHISFQAVSKWESGKTLPNTELLTALSELLCVSVDELLSGECHKTERLTYSKSGIDITYTDSIKKDMAQYLNSSDSRVLNGLGAFASLYDIKFDDISEPVLVMKAEEPGSKQKLAMRYGYMESICHDMINHLVNDIIVMGAKPLAVLDTIICGKAEKDTINAIVKGISDACNNNECSLVGGETSIQPNVIGDGTYVLTSSICGIADKKNIIDGSKICSGDAVIAIASNGLHTNGYSLVRMLMNDSPEIKTETFIEAIMKPHTAYYHALKDILNKNIISGLAHITGGGIAGNLCRIIPAGLCALVNLKKVDVLPIFSLIKSKGNISDTEMLSTFNCGVGMIAIVPQKYKQAFINHISKFYNCYEIGTIVENETKVELTGELKWC